MSDFPDLLGAFDEAVQALIVKLSNDPSANITYNGEIIQSLAKDIVDHFSEMNAMVQGRLQYKTKADMDAAGAPANGELAEVWKDPTESNNGLYGWDGAWTKSIYGSLQADSIGHVQLKNDYLSSPALVGSESLATVTQDGYHYCAANHTATDLPDGFPTNVAFVVYVADVLQGSDRFKYQTIYLWNNPRRFWFRQLDAESQAGTWYDGYQINAALQIADKTIGIEKLGDFLLTRDNLSSGTDLNLIDSEGYHYGAPNGGYLNTPSDYDPNAAFVLFNTATSHKGTRFKLQFLYLFNDPTKYWVRRSDNTGNVSWINQYQLKNDQFENVVLERNTLSNSFMANGLLPDGSDVATLTTDGVWWITSSSSYSSLPPEWQVGWSGILFNNDATGAGRYIHQVLIRYGYPGQRWERTVDLNSQSVASWIYMTKAGTRDSLEDHFLFNGTLTEGDVNALTKDGTYTLVNTGVWESYPPTSDSLQLYNTFSGSDWLMQRAVSLSDHKKEWTRMIRVGRDPSTFPEWFSVVSEPLPNPYSGKKIAYFGDSIVEFGTIPEQLAEILGATVYKMGFGGCRMAYHSQAIYNPMSMCEISGNIKSGDFTSLIDGAEALFQDKGDDNRVQAALVRETDWSSVDIVVIAFGTNDYSGAVPIGNPSDVGTTTFYGAINKVIDDLLSTHPHLKLVFVTPMFRSRLASGDGLNSDDNPNGNGTYLVEYVDAVMARAPVHKVIAKDMYRSSNIGKLTSSYYLSDGVHPSAAGYTHLAEKVAGVIRSEF
ncbi:TPA: SGNH/GDSL hydrolase family protein [Vibrio parahaemolyticus]